MFYGATKNALKVLRQFAGEMSRGAKEVGKEVLKDQTTDYVAGKIELQPNSGLNNALMVYAAGGSRKGAVVQTCNAVIGHVKQYMNNDNNNSNPNFVKETTATSLASMFEILVEPRKAEKFYANSALQRHTGEPLKPTPLFLGGKSSAPVVTSSNNILPKEGLGEEENDIQKSNTKRSRI